MAKLGEKRFQESQTCCDQISPDRIVRRTSLLRVVNKGTTSAGITIDKGKKMKETIGSLKAYFIVVAVLGFIGSFTLLSATPINLLLIILGSINLVFSVAYLYIGIALRKLIVDSPKLIANVVLASMVYQIISFAISFMGSFQSGSTYYQRGSQTGLVTQLVIGLLITWYLLNSVKRLSQEEKSKDTPSDDDYGEN